MELQGAKAYVLCRGVVTEHDAWPMELPYEPLTIWLCAAQEFMAEFPPYVQWFGFRGDFSDPNIRAEYGCWGVRVAGELGILP